MSKSLKDLRKSITDKRLAGVCGGFGEYTPMPSWLWRAIFIASIFAGGMGIIIYLILWALMPEANISPYGSASQEKEIPGETIRKE